MHRGSVRYHCLQRTERHVIHSCSLRHHCRLFPVASVYWSGLLCRQLSRLRAASLMPNGRGRSGRAKGLTYSTDPLAGHQTVVGIMKGCPRTPPIGDGNCTTACPAFVASARQIVVTISRMVNESSGNMIKLTGQRNLTKAQHHQKSLIAEMPLHVPLASAVSV